MAFIIEVTFNGDTEGFECETSQAVNTLLAEVISPDVYDTMRNEGEALEISIIWEGADDEVAGNS